MKQLSHIIRELNLGSRQLILGCIVSLLVVSTAQASTDPKPTHVSYVEQSADYQSTGPYFSHEGANSQLFDKFAQVRISAAEAKSIALRRYPNARYVNIALRGNTYYVRLQINGRVTDVRVNATTGRIS